MSAIITLDNVYKVYRMGQERIMAVNGISMQIEKGEICCLQGPSGSGKSTLLHLMAGLEKPTKGTITIGKTKIEKLSENQLAIFRQRYIGFIFQSYYLIPTLTALENVAMPLTFCGIPRSKRLRKAKELLDAVGLKDRMKHKPSQMSGGQQQRVSIARAFSNNPKIIFADEPTGNLDTANTHEMMGLMTKLSRKFNQTLVIVTHDNEISEYASRIIRIRDGKIENIENEKERDIEDEKINA
jgi:putative ABC transport system ATP-binding protein